MSRVFICNKQIVLSIGLTMGYFLYLFLGAVMFQLLEKQAEADSRDHFQMAKLQFLQNYTCLDSKALEQFVQIIMEAWEKGLNPKGNATNPSNWDFSNSFFFAGTVITTIGYGNLYPSTVAGQVFCVFYALFGIPLNLAFLNLIGKALNTHLVALGKCVRDTDNARVLRILVMSSFLVMGTLFFLVLPPMIFSYVEMELWRRVLLCLYHSQHHWIWRLCIGDGPKQTLHLHLSQSGCTLDNLRPCLVGSRL
ncbi:hypothetical protein GDO86_017842 [Hymenochirus boettgeri]|uniref:Potassium channel domain-containing protein n=1 Tax=Hymenochirus boettgeri TaxID=247094 RepID=A0A8T2IM05_9PIPI|nr:hypothetical protein GDO86_017842 [Hymenochirus boettgeri]